MRGAAQTSTMPSAAKRSREAQDDKPAPKRQRGAATSKASTRRALRAALSRYARVGQTALAAVQRAEVLSRRIEAQTREVEVALAGMMPMGAGGPTASALGPDVTAALTKAKRRLASSQRPAPADLALRLDEKGQHVDACLMRSGIWSLAQPLSALMGGNSWATGIESKTGEAAQGSFRGPSVIG